MLSEAQLGPEHAHVLAVVRFEHNAAPQRLLQIRAATSTQQQIKAIRRALTIAL